MIDYRISRFPELESTNASLYQMAVQGEPEGRVLVADHQTAGHGKLGRTWVSPPGKNLLFSVLLRPPAASSKAPLLTQTVCRAVATAIHEKAGFMPDFKRPNDLMVRGRKICGVLIESSQKNGAAKIEFALAGVGLNVNAAEGELPPGAASLKMETGRDLDRGPLLDTILKHLTLMMEPYYAHSA